MKQIDICRSYLDQEKYREIPTLTLAKKIYKNHELEFKSLESVRTSLRKLKGSSISKNQINHQNRIKDVEKYGKYNLGNRNPFPKVPEAKKHFNKWEAKRIESDNCLIISDPHVPFHSEEAIDCAVRYGKKKKVDTIILNGDTLDFWSISRWQKNPYERNFADELRIAKSFFEYLRKVFPTQKIYFKVGNHEERWWAWMMVKAIEVLDVEAFSLKQLLSLDHFNIEIVEDKRPIILNKDWCVIHGHEFYGTGGNINPARGYMLKTKMNTIVGHLHRPMTHVENLPNGEILQSYSLGCLCDLNPDYSPLNNWGHSFAIATRNGVNTEVSHVIVRNGKIVGS
jgi:predicted phosphodiesterase